jgi:hypothetical protein
MCCPYTGQVHRWARGSAYRAYNCAGLQAAHLIRGQRYVVRPVPLKVSPGDFTFAEGHDLPTMSSSWKKMNPTGK